MNWEKLRKLFNKHSADSYFIAECVYAYLSEYCQDDAKFIHDLGEFLEGEYE